MFNVLEPSGTIYIRDIKRNADWKTILNRIGEKRWNSETLVKDYVGAMAGMLTTNELEQTLQSLNIKNYEITNGKYLGNNIQNSNNIKEFQNEVEYVCVIKK